MNAWLLLFAGDAFKVAFVRSAAEEEAVSKT